MIDVAVQRERQWHIKRDDDDGDNDDGGKDDHKINSKSTFRPPQSRKDRITYCACVLGVRLRYRCHGKHVELQPEIFKNKTCETFRKDIRVYSKDFKV